MTRTTSGHTLWENEHAELHHLFQLQMLPYRQVSTPRPVPPCPFHPVSRQVWGPAGAVGRGVLRLHPPAPRSTGLQHDMPQTPREKELNVSLTF